MSTSLDQLLTDAVLSFQASEIDTCKRAILQYYGRRNKGEKEPKTIKYSVEGDRIASALLTLINSRMYPYPVDEVNRPCNHCDGE